MPLQTSATDTVKCPECGAALTIEFPYSFIYADAEVNCNCGFVIHTHADSAAEAKAELLEKVGQYK